jgi:monoamine oxidase|tara:strand:- start:1010 stop:2446 length:1437 start_codon:yes stop_codon:yes gene_type:complete
MTSYKRRMALKSLAALSTSVLFNNQLRAKTHSDIIVIGAGLSGLSAALILQDEGYKVTVLEADNRVGGRVLSERRVTGSPETGGTAFGSGYARIIDIAQRLGVELIDLNPIMPYFRNRELALDQKIIPMNEWPDHPRNLLPKNMKQLPPNAFFHQFLGKQNPLETNDDWMNPKNFIHDISVHDWLMKEGFNSDFIDLVYNLNITHGHTAKDVSVLMLMFVNAFSSNQNRLGESTSYTAKGGNMSIPEAMANNLNEPVLMNKSVGAISTQSTKAEVICEDGTKYQADHVVCSIPFSVLKNIDITPSIKGPQAEAIQKLRSQKINMLHLVPKSSFWEEDGMSPSMYTDGYAGMVLAERKGSSPEDVTSLTAWLRGSIAEQLDLMSEKEAIRAVLDAIEELRPAAKNQLEPVSYHSWSLNPYSQGDWSYWGPGQISEFGQYVGNPHGQIHFCGEHTAISNRGMEGAMESGERAAFEIMGII